VTQPEARDSAGLFGNLFRDRFLGLGLGHGAQSERLESVVHLLEMEVERTQRLELTGFEVIGYLRVRLEDLQTSQVFIALR
jgi:hypothetical protein